MPSSVNACLIQISFEMYKFTIEVEKGRGIPTPKFLQERNPYVIVNIPSTKKSFRTRVDEHSLYPSWNAKFDVFVPKDGVVNFELHDFNGAKRTTPIATLSCSIHEMLTNQKKQWRTFKSTKPHSHKIEVFMGFRTLFKPSESPEKKMDSPVIPTYPKPDIPSEMPVAYPAINSPSSQVFSPNNPPMFSPIDPNPPVFPPSTPIFSPTTKTPMFSPAGPNPPVFSPNGPSSFHQQMNEPPPGYIFSPDPSFYQSFPMKSPELQSGNANPNMVPIYNPMTPMMPPPYFFSPVGGVVTSGSVPYTPQPYGYYPYPAVYAPPQYNGTQK